MRVAQVNTLDFRGGAAQVAWNLHQAYTRRGVTSWMAAKRNTTGDSGVKAVPNWDNRSPYSRILHGLADRLDRGGRASRVGRRLLIRSAEPGRWWDVRRGLENFHYPGSWKLLELFPERPDLLHCHNLHGGYFDLRALSWLSQRLPVVLTLHDAWLLSGHCAHSFDCERWKTGCGSCPDLSIYPAIRRDATAVNWRRKQEIFARSRLYVATPCRWLMDKVERSILAPAVIEGRVIPYGIDLSILKPGDGLSARAALGIPPNARVLLFTADSIQQNMWKDYVTAREAVAKASERVQGGPLLLVALGDAGSTQRIGAAELRCVPYQDDRAVVAQYYQAADIYLHAARADTFPNAVLEALACGTPVVATTVGGIPEQVRSQGAPLANGLLVAQGDADGMAAAIVSLLSDAELRKRLGDNAAIDARRRFDLNRQVDDYLTWYSEILNSTRPEMERMEQECLN